jgi:hypothetical protein
MPIIERCSHGQSAINKCLECKKIYHRISKQANPAAYIWTAAKARARKRGVRFTIKRSDIVIPSHCPVLGIALDRSDRDHTPTLDEVVHGRGYVPRNVCVISGRANRMKSDARPEELAAIAAYARIRSLFALNGVPSSW